MILFSGHLTSLLISAARGHGQADQTWDRTVLEQSSASPAGHPFCLNYFGVALSHLCGLRILPCVFFPMPPLVGFSLSNRNCSTWSGSVFFQRHTETWATSESLPSSKFAFKAALPLPLLPLPDKTTKVKPTGACLTPTTSTHEKLRTCGLCECLQGVKYVL
jgi:hypothetical protein